MIPRLLAIIILATAPLGAVFAQFDHSHAAWTALLKKNVVVIDGGKASQARYAGFAQDRAPLKAYLDSLSKVTEAEFNGWSKPQRMAFLINAYNAFTVEKILTRYPDIKSIWDFGKVFGNPFKDKFFTLLGRESIARPHRARDAAEDRAPTTSRACTSRSTAPRSAARCCARRPTSPSGWTRSSRSRRCDSCPTARATGYNAKTGALEVSKIFDWFKEDWTSGYRGFEGRQSPIQSREQYFGRYAKLLADGVEQQKVVADGKAPIGFLEYDWALNDAKR